MVLVLSLITGVCSAALTTANIQLAPQIEKQTDLHVRGPALERLFEKPAAELLGNKVVMQVNDQAVPIFYSKKGNEVSTIAVETIGKGGFGGDLRLMVGIDLQNERMTGMEVVSHSETPGLGARIEEPGFRRQWQGRPIDKQLALTKDGGEIDAISGASTTSGAAVRGTNEVLLYVRDHKNEIIQAILQQPISKQQHKDA